MEEEAASDTPGEGGDDLSPRNPPWEAWADLRPLWAWEDPEEGPWAEEDPEDPEVPWEELEEN